MHVKPLFFAGFVLVDGGVEVFKHDGTENVDCLDFRIVFVFVFNDVALGGRIGFFKVFDLVKDHSDVVSSFFHDQVEDVVIVRQVLFTENVLDSFLDSLVVGGFYFNGDDSFFDSKAYFVDIVACEKKYNLGVCVHYVDDEILGLYGDIICLVQDDNGVFFEVLFVECDYLLYIGDASGVRGV